MKFFYDGGFVIKEVRSNSIEIKENESKILLPAVYFPKNEQLLAVRVNLLNDYEFIIFNMKLLEEKAVDKS